MSSAQDSVRREFAHQAGTSFGPGTLFASPDLAGWIDAAARLGPEDIVLDAGGGAGDLARTLAGRARQFVIADLTAEMRDRGRDEAHAAGVGNLLFVRAALEDLPFPDRSFDVVLCRFVVHHLADPPPVLAELARVCRPAGRVVVADMVVAEGVLGERHNHYERLRDPSHTTALTEPALVAAVAAAGLRIAGVETVARRLPFDGWLTRSVRTREAERAVRDAVAAELAGGEPTGMDPANANAGGTLSIGHRWARISAHRPG